MRYPRYFYLIEKILATEDKNSLTYDKANFLLNENIDNLEAKWVACMGNVKNFLNIEEDSLPNIVLISSNNTNNFCKQCGKVVF